MNPFVRRRFPNFDERVHREFHPEIGTPRRKRFLEAMLRCGLVKVAEPFSRWLLGWHLRRKLWAVSPQSPSDVLLEPQRLKLHLRSHKKQVLDRTEDSHSVSRLLAPAVHDGEK